MGESFRCRGGTLDPDLDEKRKGGAGRHKESPRAVPPGVWDKMSKENNSPYAMPSRSIDEKCAGSGQNRSPYAIPHQALDKKSKEKISLSAMPSRSIDDKKHSWVN